MWPIWFQIRLLEDQFKPDDFTQFQTSIELEYCVVACGGRTPDYRSVNLLAKAVSINWCYCFFEILLAVLANITDADVTDLVTVANLDFCSVSAYSSYEFKLGIYFRLSFRFRFLSNDLYLGRSFLDHHCATPGYDFCFGSLVCEYQNVDHVVMVTARCCCVIDSS